MEIGETGVLLPPVPVHVEEEDSIDYVLVTVQHHQMEEEGVLAMIKKQELVILQVVQV